MTTRASTRSILADLRRADLMRRRAIRKLASLTTPASSFVLADSITDVLQRKHERLVSSHNYVGHAIGLKRRCGIATADLGVTVFVRKKLSKRQLSKTSRPNVPASLRTSKGTTVPTDVVEFDVVTKQEASPGIDLAAAASKTNRGTLACFARNANDDLLAVTAGHVVRKPGDYIIPSHSGAVFGAFDQSLSSPVDAATIAVTSSYSQDFPTGGAMRGWRSLTEYDIGTTVQLYGAESESWNAGTIEYLVPWIANWKLADAIIYSSHSTRGDSGGPVVDLDGYLVGLHVGRGTYKQRDVAIANSIVRVVSELQINPDFKEQP